MRACRPTQLFGLIQNMDATTMLFYGLTGPRGQRPITSRVPDDHIFDVHRTKIQGGLEHNLSTIGSQEWTLFATGMNCA